ncbi:MAG TPA: hypothetical protein VFS03_09675, partial [Microvirga sp.]|nr:hypothetical protein [Microvirga sp.]
PPEVNTQDREFFAPARLCFTERHEDMRMLSQNLTDPASSPPNTKGTRATIISRGAGPALGTMPGPKGS